MKYCPKCKLRAPEDAETCKKCGSPVRQLGAAPAATGDGPAAPDDAARLELAGLQRQVEQSRQRVHYLAAVAVLLALAFVAFLVVLHDREVRQYCRVQSVDVAVPPGTPPGVAEITFCAASPGKLEFERRQGTHVETLTEHIADSQTGEERKFNWDGERSDDYTLTIRFRDGWSVETRHWSPPGRSR